MSHWHSNPGGWIVIYCNCEVLDSHVVWLAGAMALVAAVGYVYFWRDYQPLLPAELPSIRRHSGSGEEEDGAAAAVKVADAVKDAPATASPIAA
jgi:hypothetical protein